MLLSSVLYTIIITGRNLKVKHYFDFHQYFRKDFCMSPIVSRIVDLMSERHVTQVKLTSDLKLSATTISDWKKGKGRPQVDSLMKIAEYFQVSMDFLLTGQESRYSNLPFANARDRAILKKFQALAREGQDNLLVYADFLLAQQARNKASEAHA